MLPVTYRYDDTDVKTAYKVIVDELNAIGSETYEVVTVVSVNKPSKSRAFLKLLSVMPAEPQASDDMESKLETFFSTNAAMA